MPSDHLYRISPKQMVSWGWAGSCLEKRPLARQWHQAALSLGARARWSLPGAAAPSPSPSRPWSSAPTCCTRWSVLATPWAS